MDTFSKSDPGRSLHSLRLFAVSIQTFSLCCSLMPEIVSPSQIPFAWHGTTLRLSVFNFLTSIMKSLARPSYRCAASVSEHKHRGRSRRQYRSWGGDKLRPRGLQVASQLGPVISRELLTSVTAQTLRGRAHSRNIINFPKADPTELFEVNWTWRKLCLHFPSSCLHNNCIVILCMNLVF